MGIGLGTQNARVMLVGGARVPCALPWGAGMAVMSTADGASAPRWMIGGRPIARGAGLDFNLGFYDGVFLLAAVAGAALAVGAGGDLASAGALVTSCHGVFLSEKRTVGRVQDI